MTTLTTERLYQLNDALTATLADLGWSAQSEDDYSELNEATHDLASRFFPKGVYGEWCRDARSCAPLGHCPKDPTCGD